ncbi:MAG: energy-coupling factor transporter transmembrane protein EcfT, partial [Lachnospiraceae bacterium]|nr:energy-coupling factor transporter transmembrane protein EcfT [Lachnospiraceae bacterium]
MGVESYHPAINFIFFASVIAGTVCFNHPAFLAISWVCAFLYSVKRNGVKALIFDLVLIPLILVFASYYSGYTHFGLT